MFANTSRRTSVAAAIPHAQATGKRKAGRSGVLWLLAGAVVVALGGCMTTPVLNETKLVTTPTIVPVALPENEAAEQLENPESTVEPEPMTAPLVAEPAEHEPAATAAADAEPFPYGLVYALETDNWSESDRPVLRAQMERLSAMGVNAIVQTFSSRLVGTGREEDWLILLDEAERAGIQVIARLWPLDEWNGESVPFPEEVAFLGVVAGHPALKAYLGLHEPLEHYTSAQMQNFYDQIKAVEPDLPVAHYLGDLAYFDDSWRFPNRRFSSGICDVCIVWCTPAQHLNGQPYLDETLLSRTVTENRRLVDDRSPTSELWFMGQTYALHAHRHQLRMPEPEEMDVMFRVAREGGADGFLWYPWFHGAYDQVLADPESAEQQLAVATIARNYLGLREAEAQPVQTR